MGRMLGNRVEATFEDYVLAAPRLEMYLQHRLHTHTHRTWGCRLA